MAKKQSLTDQMRANPRADWTIDHVAKVCEEHNISFMPPSRGTHYKAASRHLDGHLTIPAHRPIKPFYIKQLITMVDAHLAVEIRKEQK